MFKRKKIDLQKEIKGDELLESELEQEVTLERLENTEGNNSDNNASAENIDYKKEIIKMVTISGHLNKVQMVAIRAYLKKTTEEERKDMYEKIKEEGLDCIINKFKAGNVITKMNR